MSLRSVLFVAALLSILTSGARAEQALRCELAVFCQDTTQIGRGELVFKDTVPFVKGIRTSGFFANFSAEFQFDKIDTGGASFSVQVVTLGPSAFNLSRRFVAEYHLPARIDGIQGKGTTAYSLVVTPLGPTTQDTSSCGYLHYRKDDFRWDPSANVDIYFVPRTHGDYYWNAIKMIMEDRYTQFAQLNNFNLPGKYLLYLCPCTIPSVIWDTRFGTMVDPTRNATFALLNKNVNTADPYLLMHVSVLRNYGYAPPVLVEGFAGYISLASYDMKQILKDGKQVPLDSFMRSYTFYRTDPRVADAEASTFARYLIDRYKADKFIAAYRQANDLNLKATLEAAYGKTLADLEKEWLTYVDTLKIRHDQFAYWAGQADIMMNYSGMLTYCREELKSSENLKDSIAALGDLSRADFFVGDFRGAAEAGGKLAQLQDTSSTNWMTLGSYLMMTGQNDSAYIDLIKARTMDTSSQLAIFNLAMYYTVSGQGQKGIDLLNHYVQLEGKSPAIAQSRVLLGNLLMRTGDHANIGLARSFYRQAIGMLAQFTSGNLIESSALMWTGIAQLGLGDTGAASDGLTMAQYLETRPFYQSMINLWLGKTADIRGEREVAKEYYQKVLSSPAADYHQKEARQLLQTPYTN